MAKKPKASFQIEDEDKRALEVVTQLVRRTLPALGDQSGSVVLRAALRFGLAELLKNPASAATAVPPDVKPLLDQWAYDADQAEQMAYAQDMQDEARERDEAGPTGEALRRALAEGTPKRRGRGRPPKAP